MVHSYLFIWQVGLSVPGYQMEPSIHSRNTMPHGEYSKTQVLIRDILSWEEKTSSNKQVVGPIQCQHPQLYRIKRIMPCYTSTSPTPQSLCSWSQHITPQLYPYDICVPFLPMHSFPSCFTFLCFFLPFSSYSLPIQPLWPWSILIGHSTYLMFSKKQPYWMVLMPVYIGMAEGLLKPLVILPATIMSFAPFIIIFSSHHHLLCFH